MKFIVRIENMATEKWIKYHISAPSSLLAYRWGQRQGTQKFYDDLGMIDVKKGNGDGQKNRRS